MGFPRYSNPPGVTPPMCWCGDPCRVELSYDKETWKQRYWMCANWAFDPPEKAIILGKLVIVVVHILLGRNYVHNVSIFPNIAGASSVV